MASDSKLEKSIKRYSDVFGTVLLGMHQDLQAQQQTVDKKLAEWDQSARKRSEEVQLAQAAITSSRDEIKSMADDVGDACKDLANAVESTNSAIARQLNAIDAASTRLFKDIRALLEQIRIDTDKRLEAIAQLQELHQAKVEAFARQTRYFLLVAVGIAAVLVGLGVIMR
jgi:chromosome segregation ATPase